MLRSRIQYILTWIALAILLINGIFLVAISWNGILSGSPSLMLMVFLWVGISAAGIYLFMLAVKKAHRLWVDEERTLSADDNKEKRSTGKKDTSKDSQVFDFASIARKLVRRTPENASLEDAGKGIMKNLARELEIMAGVVYIRRKAHFEAVANYASAISSEPYSFKEGEGLTGQVARNQQILILTRLPEEHMEVYSGLGKSKPAYLAIVPLIHKNKTVAVIECSGFKYDPHDIENMFRVFARDLMEKISPNLS